MGTKGITVAGSLIVDVYYMTDTYPGIGRLTNIRDIKKGVGGSGNLIQDLAKLDPNLQVKVSALLGNDANGKFAKQAPGTFPQYRHVQCNPIRGHIHDHGNRTP